MERPNRAQLGQLTQDELIDLVARLFGELERVQSAVSQLRSELGPRKQAPATSRNSSRPPSRDPKTNKPPRLWPAAGSDGGLLATPAARDMSAPRRSWANCSASI